MRNSSLIIELEYLNTFASKSSEEKKSRVFHSQERFVFFPTLLTMMNNPGKIPDYFGVFNHCRLYVLSRSFDKYWDNVWEKNTNDHPSFWQSLNTQRCIDVSRLSRAVFLWQLSSIRIDLNHDAPELNDLRRTMCRRRILCSRFERVLSCNPWKEFLIRIKIHRMFSLMKNKKN